MFQAVRYKITDRNQARVGGNKGLHHNTVMARLCDQWLIVSNPCTCIAQVPLTVSVIHGLNVGSRKLRALPQPIIAIYITTHPGTFSKVRKLPLVDGNSSKKDKKINTI